MEKKILFPQIGGIMHGGDYNPEQWLDRPDILEEDIRMMKKAGMNCATLGVFSWSTYEPREGEFHFAWLEEPRDIFAGGLWVHTFNSLLPASVYGAEHPEYYSFINGERRPGRARHGWMKHIRSADAWIPTGCVNITGCGTTTV
jgi:hypothetical protein